MTHLFRIFTLMMLVLIGTSPAYASTQDWLVARTTKQVSYTIDKQTWEAVEVGTIIPSKAWISTGPRGRVTLTRGVESLSLSPNTLGSVITTQGLFSRKTEVVQQKGQIALDIEKRSKPHTYVHTPFLAAVVKGTTFTVTVTEKDASVAVEEGLVQVSSFTGGESTNVGPGQQATVNQAQHMSVAGVSQAPSVFSVEPTRASVPAVGRNAAIGAGMGLGSFADRSAAGAAENAGSNGVSGESSEGGNRFSQSEQHSQRPDGVGSGSNSGAFGNSGGDRPGNGVGPGNNNGVGSGNNNGVGPGNNNGVGPGNNNGVGPGANNGVGHVPGR